MTSYQTDVLICGSGPAGVSAAYTLGKAGVNVLVIDRKTHDEIGNKVCGDALSPYWTNYCYQEVGLPQPNQDENELMEYCDNIILRIESGKNYPLGRPSATVDRKRYGQALLAEIEKFESVTVMAETRIREVLVEDHAVVGVTALHNGDIIHIGSKVLIDATGSTGVVRSRLPEEMCEKFPRKIQPEDILVAYREIIRTPKPHDYQKGLYIVYEPEIKEVQPAYYWFFSRGEHELNIGLGYLKTKNNRGKNIRAINERVRKKYFPECEVLTSQGDQIPARMPLPSLVHNGFIAVGDAGALANPLNGEGHAPALVSGIEAARQILKCIESDDFSEKGLWEYNKWIWHHYGVEFVAGIAIIKFIQRYGYNNFDWLIEHGIITQSDINQQLDNPDKSHWSMLPRLVKLLRKPKVMLGLLKTMRFTDKLKNHAMIYPDYEDFPTWNEKLEKMLNNGL